MNRIGAVYLFRDERCCGPRNRAMCLVKLSSSESTLLRHFILSERKGKNETSRKKWFQSELFLNVLSFFYGKNFSCYCSLMFCFERKTENALIQIELMND